MRNIEHKRLVREAERDEDRELESLARQLQGTELAGEAMMYLHNGEARDEVYWPDVRADILADLRRELAS